MVCIDDGVSLERGRRGEEEEETSGLGEIFIYQDKVVSRVLACWGCMRRAMPQALEATIEVYSATFHGSETSTQRGGLL